MNNLDPQNLLAVGIDTASRSHHAVAMRFPEQIIFDEELKNIHPSFQSFEQRIQAMASEHGLTVVYGIEGSGSYGKETSVNELSAKIKQLVESARDIKVDIVYEPPRAGEIKNNYADIGKARRMLDYGPQIKLEEGLEETWNWFKTSL